MTDKTQIGQIVMIVITAPIVTFSVIIAIWLVVEFFRDVFAPIPEPAASEIEPLRVGDSVPHSAIIIRQRLIDGKFQCAIADGGTIIWVGDNAAFCRLVRDAALDRSLSC